MHTPILLLNARYGGSGETEQYLVHFSEHFTTLGYRVHLGYGHKDADGDSSPVMGEFPLPYLGEDAGPLHPSDLKHLAGEAIRLETRLIFLHDLHDSGFVPALKQSLPDVPVVWFAHGVPPPLPASSHARVPPQLPEDEILEGMQSAERIVTTDPAMAEWLSTRWKGLFPPPRVLPPWHHDTPSDRSSVRQGCVMYAGPIMKEKGLAELIVAMGLVQGVPGRCLRVLGPAPDREYLAHCQEKAEQVEMSCGDLWIEIHPDPPAEEIERMYAQAALFAVPALLPEPFPAEAMVAMERGLPVVAFDVGGVDEFVKDGETGLLALPGDVKDLAGKMQQLLSRSGQARRLGKAAGVLAGWEFHSREHVSALNRVFEDLLYPLRSELTRPSGAWEEEHPFLQVGGA